MKAVQGKQGHGGNQGTTEGKRKAAREDAASARGRQWPRAKLAVDGAEIVRDDPGLAERAREGKDSAAKRGREGEKEKIRG